MFATPAPGTAELWLSCAIRIVHDVISLEWLMALCILDAGLL
jgi:hypothetical protein